MARETVNIKGTKNGLVILFDTTKDFDELKSNLIKKFESSKGFFKGAKFTFDIAFNKLSVDKARELEEICLSHGLIPNVDYSPPTKEIKNTTKIKGKGLESGDIVSPTLIIRKNIRSGQKIRYKGNVTVLGDVNPGAEIIAGGSIFVMGTLRGLAHAGAAGDLNACIIAFRLNPIQLRINDKIARPPEKGPFPAYYPEKAYIKDGQIIIEEYSIN